MDWGETKMIIAKRIIKYLIMTFFMIWLISSLRCEILTIIHGKEFPDDLYSENTMLGDTKYIKILDYSSDFARIYRVGENYSGGDILTFTKEKGKWKYNDWETVWSGRGGSASGVIWPYWWHFVYGGI